MKRHPKIVSKDSINVTFSLWPITRFLMPAKDGELQYLVSIGETAGYIF